MAERAIESNALARSLRNIIKLDLSELAVGCVLEGQTSGRIHSIAFGTKTKTETKIESESEFEFECSRKSER